MSSAKSSNCDDLSSSEETKDALALAMERIDPFLRFLTKATGKTMLPLQMLQKVLPKAAENKHAETNLTTTTTTAAAAAENSPEHMNQNELLLELTYRGVLHYDGEKSVVGFPQPPSTNKSDKESPKASLLPKPPAKLIGKGLHGSSEAVAKRRMKVLLWTLEKESSWICRMSDEALDDKTSDEAKASCLKMRRASPENARMKRTALDAPDVASSEPNINSEESFNGTENEHASDDADEINSKCSERAEAFKALHNLFSRERRNIEDDLNEKTKQTKHWLPCQAAFAGSQPGRDPRFGILSKDTLDKIPSEVLHLFHLNRNDIVNGKIKPTIDTCLSKNNRKLFLHQALAIEAAMNGVHTVVCTSTGSGKSMCFLLPVIAKTLASLQNGDGYASILMFPTKALAQDQLTKINAMLNSLSPDFGDQLRAGVIDGDTPHTQRDTIASECQIILTNPDTLHAAILPNWKRPAYKQLLERVRTVVIDEAHVYEGTFGAHVSLVLAVSVSMPCAPCQLHASILMILHHT
jgi:DEAD/DEAH box helicase domain-containing protein